MTILIFFLCAIIGSLYYPQDIIDEFTQVQETVISQDGFFIFLRLFLQNTFVCLLLAFGGLFLAIPTVIILGFNGVIQGILFRFFSEQIGLFQVLLYIAPHGVFELTAFFLSASWGLYMGIEHKQSLFRKKALKTARFFLYMIPLLFLAAIIETVLILVL